MVLLARCWILVVAAGAVAQDAAVSLRDRIARITEPLVADVGEFAFDARAARAGERPIEIGFVRRGDDGFALRVRSPWADLVLLRTAASTRLELPAVGVALVGSGEVDEDGGLAPRGFVARLLGRRAAAVGLLRAAVLAQIGAIDVGGWNFDLRIGDVAPAARATELEERRVARDEFERTVLRALRRVIELELAAPHEAVCERAVERGELVLAEGQRIARLAGTPEEIGRAHGELLGPLVRQTVDSCLYLVGLIETVRTGRWFPAELEAAWRRLQVPSRHVREIDALADAVPGVTRRELRLANVFPEYFHCSGFAVFGRATTDGTLYHGRVLDYMTEIGLQRAAVTFAVRPERGYAFVNVGYAGFVGSVTGLNERGISLGELGGGGRGDWDGVPMASLMRRALEECATLDDVRTLWREAPRTCEYFYVAADGKRGSAVGIAATPDSIEFIEPGAEHVRLPSAIEDAVFLSAGDRLQLLHDRIVDAHGRIEVQTALRLMDRPVAMRSNLHNVLMVPATGEVWVAHAGDAKPAAECRYVRHELDALLGDAGRGAARTFGARDSIVPDAELGDLAWEPERFDVGVRPRARGEEGSWRSLVTFASPRSTGDADNDRVVLEWYAPRRAARHAPAVLVLHILDGRMRIARGLATGFSRHGVHAFVMHLPTYGRRGDRDARSDPARWLGAMQQGIADARRARDAIAALPGIDPAAVDIQGTSLGAFVAATAAALDRGFRHAFLLLAGGGLREMFENGEQDVARLRARAARAGLGGEELGAALDAIDPARLAHRLDASRTWLFSARADRVVPAANARILGAAAGLDAEHHVWFEGDHYSAIVHLPEVFLRMLETVKSEAR